MAWRRVDDGFDVHPKTLELAELGPIRFGAAVALWTLAGCHASRAADRRVTGAYVRRVKVTKPARAAEDLVSVGLWHAHDDGSYSFHDEHDYNPSPEQIRRKRQQKTERQRRWRARRDAGSDDSVDADVDASTLRPVDGLPLARARGDGTGRVDLKIPTLSDPTRNPEAPSAPGGSSGGGPVVPLERLSAPESPGAAQTTGPRGSVVRAREKRREAAATHAEIGELEERLGRGLAGQAREAIGLSRKTGRVTDTVWLRTLQKLLAQGDEPARRGARIFVDRYADGDKREEYLIGIARREKTRGSASPAAAPLFADEDPDDVWGKGKHAETRRSRREDPSRGRRKPEDRS